MANERLSNPQDALYFQSLGLAVVAFARLEWMVVWCSEKLSPGYIKTIKSKKKTAGRVAKDARCIFEQAEPSVLRHALLKGGDEFSALVIRRNHLLHANPATTEDGDQRLIDSGKPWQPSDVDAFADECTILGHQFNRIFYEHLNQC
ncbi:hypothetical protein [Loktanella sp. Alg231-35]|uniref:hypothetical protein n=1 Tax=Loktanella sp. Alg231-35 TaxID=1922220 RepID=UPI0019021B75|nr:hypothetical protein [Loktanella sp. Alg231-35]